DHHRAPPHPRKGARKSLTKGEAALGRRLRRHVDVHENRQEWNLGREAAKRVRDRERRSYPGAECECGVETLILHQRRQLLAGLSVDTPEPLVLAGALRTIAAVDHEWRHAVHHKLLAVTVGDDDDEIGFKSA